MIASVIAFGLAFFSHVQVDPRQNGDVFLHIQESDKVHTTHHTVLFRCPNRVVEVQYLVGNLGGDDPRLGSYIESIFVDGTYISFHDLNVINEAIGGRVIEKIGQPYCSSGGAAWVEPRAGRVPDLGRSEHALKLNFVRSQEGELRTEQVTVFFFKSKVDRIEISEP